MKEFAFITRHQPTQGQFDLASQVGIALTVVGDRDAFTDELNDIATYFDGVVVVHPALALKAKALGLEVGVFENKNRAPEGEKPSFEAVAFHLF